MKRHPRSQDGTGMAELLVALALGLLVSLAAGALLVFANAGYAAHTELANVDDAGRQALEVIARSARQSAFVNFDGEGGRLLDVAGPVPVEGLDDHTLGRASAGLEGARPGAVNGSDVLALRHAGSGSGPDGDGSVLSCAGFGIGQQRVGWSIFYVAKNADGQAELRCKYRGKTSWGSDALVAGVDTFQVLYGVDTDALADGLPNVYLNAQGVRALDAGLTPHGASAAARERDRLRITFWKRVASVKVALLLHGQARARTERSALVFDLFGSAHAERASAGDAGSRLAEARLAPELRRRERRAFSATIVLRNGAS